VWRCGADVWEVERARDRQSLRAGTGGASRGRGLFRQASSCDDRVMSDSPEIDPGVRLQRLLAMAGIGSRRSCEEYITTGRVTVDGQTITELGARVDPDTQDVRLDGERLRVHRRSYYLVNKPTGVLCTNRDPEGRPRVIDLFPKASERLFTVGRLDENSEGLLLVTNDGELAHRLAHPRFRVEKIYRVQVAGVPSREIVQQLQEGMYFAEGRFAAKSAELVKTKGHSSLLEIVLMEGQNREIRRLLARVGHKVQRLKRVGLGSLRLGELPPGAYRPLSPQEIRELQALVTGGSRRGRERGRGGARGDRGRPDRRRGERSRSGRSASERSRTERVRGERPRGERPAGDSLREGRRGAEGGRPPRAGFRPRPAERGERPARRGAEDRPGRLSRGERPPRREGSARPPESQRRPPRGAGADESLGGFDPSESPVVRRRPAPGFRPGRPDRPSRRPPVGEGGADYVPRELQRNLEDDEGPAPRTRPTGRSDRPRTQSARRDLPGRPPRPDAGATESAEGGSQPRRPGRPRPEGREAGRPGGRQGSRAGSRAGSRPGSQSRGKFQRREEGGGRSAGRTFEAGGSGERGGRSDRRAPSAKPRRPGRPPRDLPPPRSSGSDLPEA